MNGPTDDMVKVIFLLQRDAEGYPPAEAEGLWATPLGHGRFKLDNIPFYAKGISTEDIVEAREKGGDFYFERLVTSSGHSTIRVIARDKSYIPEMRKQLEQLGCSSEVSHLSILIAIDVPPEASWNRIAAFLNDIERRSLIEYEEGALRHTKGEFLTRWKLW